MKPVKIEIVEVASEHVKPTFDMLPVRACFACNGAIWVKYNSCNAIRLDTFKLQTFVAPYPIDHVYSKLTIKVE